MKTELSQYPEFHKAICNNELVYLFGTGISSALTNQRFGWWKWIMDGISYLKDKKLAAALERSLKNDSSTDNMIKVVGDVLRAAKSDDVYDTWMKDSFETHPISNQLLAETLKKLLLTQDVFVTTNYDRLLELATGLTSLSYAEPDAAFSMLDHKVSKSVLHIHGIYDSARGLDNIIADEDQYKAICDDKGAQFIQHILSTRTLIFIGCGKTTEDANIAQFIQFAKEWLNMDRPYYFLHNSKQGFDGMPDNIELIPYGDEYDDLPAFLEDIAQLRIRTKIVTSPLVDRTLYSERKNDAYGLSEYHFSKEYLKFCGRKIELGQLTCFAETDKRFSWWAVTGQGGAGKSRLAYELMRHIGTSYFVFYMNPNATEDYVRSFTPFNDTFVIVDYIKGNEVRIAQIIMCLEEKFRDTWYRLRVLFLERDNQLLTGSWYQQLVANLSFSFRSRFYDAEYNRMLASNSHRFIYLDDLEDEAVVELIGSVCEKRGLPADRYRDEELKNEYAQKFEQLRFRPLFLQMYVEAWIDNGCVQVDYRNHQELLKSVLSKEQERILAAVNHDVSTCNALLRLMIRAGIQGEMAISTLPAMYQEDWNIVKQHSRLFSLPGIQRTEYLTSLLGDAGQETAPEAAILKPLYPDIIKEAMFLYYVDEDDLVAIGTELWENCPEAFAAFLSRLLVDFADHAGIRRYIRAVTADYQNVYALEVRFSLLQNEVVHAEDDIGELRQIVQDEYAFWKAMPVDTDTYALIRLKGLNYSAIKLIGWSDMEGMTALRLIADADGNRLEFHKIEYLLAQAHYFTERTSATFSNQVIKMVSPIIEELPAGKKKDLLWMRLEREDILNLLQERKLDSAWLAYEQVKDRTVMSDEQYVEQYAYVCYSCVERCYTLLEHGKLLDYAFALQDLAEAYGEQKENIAFNDRIHHYYLHAKAFQVDTVSMHAALIGQLGYSISLIKGLIDEIESNIMISDFSGLLVWMWSLYIGTDETVTDKQVKEFLARTDALLDTYPDNEVLAAKAMDLWETAYTLQFRQKVPQAIVQRAHALLLRFAGFCDVLDAFHELLKHSDAVNDQVKWAGYYCNKKITTALVQNNRIDYTIPPDIPQETYVRRHPKIGANEKCPCGSGKKFKKCCRGKGIYD